MTLAELLRVAVAKPVTAAPKSAGAATKGALVGTADVLVGVIGPAEGRPVKPARYERPGRYVAK